MTEIPLPSESILRIDIDDEACCRCRSCCAGGCTPATSILTDPGNDSIPVFVADRDAWIESDIVDAIVGCPCEAIEATYETYRMTPVGIRPINPDHEQPKHWCRYNVESDSRKRVEGDTLVESLQFTVIDAWSGKRVRNFYGTMVFHREYPDVLIRHEGIKIATLTSCRTALSLTNTRGQHEIDALPTPVSESRHYRWLIKKIEEVCGRAYQEIDYRMTFQIIDSIRGEVIAQYEGSEDRTPGGDLYQVRGVRVVEVTSDGEWMIVTRFDRAPEWIRLPNC